MKNLIKNVLRSFKHNKISIIGLVFLLFFGLGAFCVMNNTTTNITNEYTSLANKGNLHDFTASELYEVGSASYTTPINGVSYDVNTLGVASNFNHIEDLSKVEVEEKTFTTNWLYTGSTLSINEGTYYVALPHIDHFQQGDNEAFTRTYNITLDDKTSTGLYQQFAVAKADTRYTQYTFKVTAIYNQEHPHDNLYRRLNNLYTVQESGYTTDNWDVIAGDNLFSTDYQDFSKFLNNQSQETLSLMTTKDTPLAVQLTDKYSKELNYRFFKSLNVTATKDNIFYKIIDSNPEDSIDKMVLFSDPDGIRGNQLFSVNDWSPYNSSIVVYDLNNKVIEPGTKIETGTASFIIPNDFNDVAETVLYPLDQIASWTGEVKFAYCQILQIRFKRMLAGDRSTTALDTILKNLAARNLNYHEYANLLLNFSSPLAQSYTEYLDNWYNGAGESVTISSNGNVVFTWIELLGTPQTCTISNWTSRFSIINPQYLEKNNKRVLNFSLILNFIPFREWYKATYGSNPTSLSQDVAKAWFNSLTQNQFAFWINPSIKQEWESMSYDIPGKEPIVVKRSDWAGIDKKYIADCGGYNQIIWGCGLTPDFMYPVVDISRPTPNTKTECLVYCNEAGYNTIKLAFINSPSEDYVVGTFKTKVNVARQKEIINEINDWAKQNMIYPTDVKSAYFANDTSNVLNCSGFRVAYLPRLVHVVEIVSTILCSFIGILCLVICFVIIKRYVERNRVNIGIMRANGIKKWKIAISLLPFALLPAVVGGISAYVTGLGLQAAALSLFKSYWMLPTTLIKFNWISFLSSIFIPFIIFSAICWITTLIVLRVNTVELMKPGSEFKTNSFSRIVKKPFKHFGVLTRFRVALAFNSISRLLMLAAMSCLTMSSLVFAMTTFNKLNQSHELNSSQFDYSFNVELTTPTSSGSTYSTYDYSQTQPDHPELIKGLGWSDPTQYLFNTYWNTTAEQGHDWSTQDGQNSYSQLTKPYSRNIIVSLLQDEGYCDAVGHYGNLVLPTIADATGQNQDLLYVQNKISTRMVLDYSMGVPGLAASNPWEIAVALMPANSRNVAAECFNDIVNNVGHKIYQAHEIFVNTAKQLGLEFADEETGLIYYEDAHQQELVHLAAANAGKWFGLGKHYETIPYVDPAYWYSQYPQFFSYVEDVHGNRTYSLNTDILTVGYLFMAFNTDFINLIETIYSDPEITKLEYPIAYGVIPLNWDANDGNKTDETYTYVSGTIKKLSNNHEFDSSHGITIQGIKQNSQYIKLTDKKGNNLNKWLFDETYLKGQNINGDVYPIIINSYAAHKYKLKTNDVITLSVTNSADRYDQQIHPQSYPHNYNDAKFKVIGVSQGTNDEAFYTTQDVANNVLGLPDGQSWNKTHHYMMWTEPDEGLAWRDWSEKRPLLADLSGIGSPNADHITKYTFTNGQGQSRPQPDYTTEKLKDPSMTPPVGFNGIYTENKTGKPITSGVYLYSYTGLYPGTSVYKSNGSNNKFADILMFQNNLSIANLMSGINDTKYYDANAKYLVDHDEATYRAVINEFVKTISNIYGDTTMITAITGATDVEASDLIYSNLISTFNLAEASIMAIIIPITIIIVAIISNLIIIDSKRMAAMLKALGYSDSKNLMSILALFVPTIAFGLLLAIPLSLGLTLGYQAIIFNTANILVDVTQRWWFYVAAIGGIGIILVTTYAIGYVSLKKDRLVDQIK